MSTMKILADIEDLKQANNSLKKEISELQSRIETLEQDKPDQKQEQKSRGRPRKDG